MFTGTNVINSYGNRPSLLPPSLVLKKELNPISTLGAQNLLKRPRIDELEVPKNRKKIKKSETKNSRTSPKDLFTPSHAELYRQKWLDILARDKEIAAVIAQEQYASNCCLHGLIPLHVEPHNAYPNTHTIDFSDNPSIINTWDELTLTADEVVQLLSEYPSSQLEAIPLTITDN